MDRKSQEHVTSCHKYTKETFMEKTHRVNASEAAYRSRDVALDKDHVDQV